MSNPIKQHYVPQTYLKHFSYEAKDPYKLFLLRKKERKICANSAEKIAVERHFYTVKDQEDEYAWEKYYAENVEPLMDGVITKILSVCSSALLQNHSTILTPELKEQLARIMTFQLIRGKQAREFEKSIYEEEFSSLIKKSRVFGPHNQKDEEKLEEYKNDEDKFKQVVMEITLNEKRIKMYTKILMQRSFVVYKIAGDKDFVTSDNPVMLIDSSTLDATPFRNGVAQRSTVALYPLSPKVVIAAYHPEYFMGGLVDYDGKYVLLNSNINFRFIENHNKKQFEQCFDQLYARSKETLEEICCLDG